MAKPCMATSPGTWTVLHRLSGEYLKSQLPFKRKNGWRTPSNCEGKVWARSEREAATEEVLTNKENKQAPDIHNACLIFIIFLLFHLTTKLA